MKPTSKSKASRPSAPKRQGDGAVRYNGGKVLRSDTSESWRVFLQANDKVDKKVKWNGSAGKSWSLALDLIDSQYK